MAGVVVVEDLAGMFVEFADTLVDDFDVIEFLQRVSGRIAELVGPAVVGVLLADPGGDLRFIAASDESAAMIELFELSSREGPGMDVFLAGSPLTILDLRGTVGRWPGFGPRAVASGFECAHAFPMRLRGQSIGMLNVLGRSTLSLTLGDQMILQALVDVATIGLLQERAIRGNEVLAEQLQTALSSRIVIEQAKGALAQFHQISVDEAFIRLRRYARDRGRRLTDIAGLVISAGPASFAQG